MKILHTVEFYYPSKGGAQAVVQQLSERMAAKGHDVTVATTKLPERKKSIVNGVKIVEFAIGGNAIVGMKGETKKYQDFLVNGNFDVVMNYAAQQWATDLAYDVLPSIKGRKILVPCGYSALHNPDFDDYFQRLPDVLREYDYSVYSSATYQDFVFAKKHRLKNIRVIPNGADEREFTSKVSKLAFKKRHTVSGFFILTLGNHTGFKGHAESLEVIEHLPFPATLMIIGGESDDGCFEQCRKKAAEINRAQKDKKVILLSAARDETISAMMSADLFLFLSNVESSPLVLFESAAAGLPFASTNVGNSAEIANWTKDGKITKTVLDPLRAGNAKADINATVKLVTKLQRRPRLLRKMGRKGRENWLKKFTWGKITDQYLDLYQESRK